MAAFRSQCEVNDPMEVDPPPLIMEESKLAGQIPLRESKEEESVQLVDADDGEEDEIKVINNLKKKQQIVVATFDSLSYDSSPSLTPPDSPAARDCSSPPLLLWHRRLCMSGSCSVVVEGGKRGDVAKPLE